MNIKFINDQKRALKLSNPRISQLTGITLPTLNKITAGANTNPTLDTLQALATALQCTIDDLACDADEGRYSADARRLALDFDKLDPRGQRVVRRCMDAELDEQDEKKEPASDGSGLTPEGVRIAEKIDRLSADSRRELEKYVDFLVSQARRDT